MKTNAKQTENNHWNKNITPEINSRFITSGCYPMTVQTGIDYYHSKAGIYIRYSPKLLEGPYSAQENLTEIVIVTDDKTVVSTSTGYIPCEIVKITDFLEFLKFRESSLECITHRAARICYEQSQDDLLDAHDEVRNSTKTLNRIISKIEASKEKVAIAAERLSKVTDANISALATYFATKPPRFIAKHAAYVATLCRVDVDRALAAAA